MLTLKQLPTTAAQWRESIDQSIRRWISPIKIDLTGELPILDSVNIDLSGGTRSTAPPPDLKIVSPTAPGPGVQSLTIVGSPVIWNGITANIDMSMKSASFATGSNAAGEVVVRLENGTDPRLVLHIDRPNLDAALLQAARAGAAAHGITIASVQSQLQAVGSRELKVDLKITAKKFMTAVIRVSGDLSIDDQLNAVAKNLRAEGAGMVANIAVGFIRPQLEKIEGKPISLLSFSLGNLRLHDLSANTDDGLTVKAS